MDATAFSNDSDSDAVEETISIGNQVRGMNVEHFNFFYLKYSNPALL